MRSSEVRDILVSGILIATLAHVAMPLLRRCLVYNYCSLEEYTSAGRLVKFTTRVIAQQLLASTRLITSIDRRFLTLHYIL